MHKLAGSRGKCSSTATALASGGLLDEVVHKRRTVSRRSALALGTKFLIEQETLKDGVTCEGEDAHENGTDEETDKGCDDAREVRRGYLCLYLWPLGHL